MLRHLLVVFVMLWGVAVCAQNEKTIVVKIVDAAEKPLAQASVALLRTDSSLVKISVTDSDGTVQFINPGLSHYILHASLVGYVTAFWLLDAKETAYRFTLQPSTRALDGVTVTTRKPFIVLKPDRTVINLDASISNVGTTVLEALEKLPGVTVDKDGNISLKGRAGVKVMIDGKLTYLDGTELANLLSSMNSAEVTQVELMDTPPASMDASGNAGIINIKTKKGTQSGFNGSLTAAPSQGSYFKSNNSLLLNYRAGKTNVFANYSLTTREDFTSVYAFRTYYKTDGSISSFLEQPSFLKNNQTANTLRTGFDYTLNDKTTLSLTLSGLLRNTRSDGSNPAIWMKTRGQIDSIIHTASSNKRDLQNGQVSLDFRHAFHSGGELSADADLIGYRIRGKQSVDNSGANYAEFYRADIPTNYRILVGKIDYSDKVGAVRVDAGVKSSQTNTDNLADYEYNNGAGWTPDYGKSNHFLYKENIHAAYANAQTKSGKWNVQGGLRYEATTYNAKQLTKDSSFSSNYNGLFPSASVSFESDSFNTFSLSASRRIDRPLFQWLNPFVQIINKYTYQTGNPYFKPQYTWNIELSHAYKNLLFTSLSYNVSTNYFSQIFPTDSNGIVTYTQGNLKRRQNFGASVGLQLSPATWWSFTLQTQVNHKRFEGIVIGRSMMTSVTQYTLNANNQLHFKNGWAGEVSGVYNSPGQEDIQETLNPYGQLTLGLSKSIAQNKGLIKLTARDILYTNKFGGFSTFSQSTESFNISRDTRLIALGFTWRFGRAYKTPKRSEGAAADEIQRAGNE